METKNLDIYGSVAIQWSRARDALAASRGPAVTFFLGTVRPDATPHAARGRRRLGGRHFVVRDRPADPEGAQPRRQPRVHDLGAAGGHRRSKAAGNGWPIHTRSNGSPPCTARPAGRRKSTATRSRRHTARRAPGRHHGTGTASSAAQRSASRPLSPTELRVGGSVIR
mgnify:CR=1 FL=1